MKTKFKERDGELFLFTNYFDLKLTRTRQVMIRNSGENQFNVIEGVESVKGSSMESKKDFLLHLAYGVHYRIMQDTEKNNDENIKKVKNEDEENQEKETTVEG